MLHRLLEQLQSLPAFHGAPGPQAFFLFGSLVVLSQLLLLPISPIDVAAGLLFGFWPATALMLVAKMSSALLSGFLARSIARKPAERLATRFPLAKGLDAAIAKGGWKLAAMCRLCPLPFGAASYFFGLTRLPHLQHALATGLAVIPPTVLFASMGASAKKGLASLEGQTPPSDRWGQALLLVGIVAAFLVIRRISKLALQAIQEAQASEPSSPSPKASLSKSPDDPKLP